MVVINFSTSHNQRCHAVLDNSEVLIMLSSSLKSSPIGFRHKNRQCCFYFFFFRKHVNSAPSPLCLAVAEKNVMKGCFNVFWEDWQSSFCSP